MKNALCAMALAATTFAATQPVLADGEREYAYVSKVNVGSDNHLYINVTGNFSTIHGCTRPWYVQSQWPLSDERTKAWMQIALSSFLSKKKVYVWTAGCTSYGYPILTKLQLQQD
jgi:hypothetical protein